jgi:hypothetical protein
MYLPSGESPEKIRVGRVGTRVLLSFLGLALAGLVVFGGTLSAYAACSNPSPLPSGYAAPCPVFSVSPASLTQSGTLTLSASPQPGTDYIYTTAYYAQGSTWTATTLQGNNAAPSYSSGPAQGSLTPSILSSLPLGTNYVVLWDWLWDSTAGCYKGPGLNQCNTGTWRLQEFNLTAPTTNSCLTSTIAFQSQAIPAQSGSFRITFDATPTMNLMDGDIGLSANAAAAYTDMAAIVEFNNTDDITARNGGVYQAITAIPYTAGSAYHFRLDINIPNHTYSAYVTPTGQAEQAIGTNYAFRTEQASVASLAYLNLANTTGSQTLCNSLVSLSTSTSPTPTPTPTPTPSPTGCTSGCTNYYVSTTGSDSNSGTQAAPWKTLTHADSALTLGTSGTVVHVAAGTYSSNVSVNRGGSSQSLRLVIQCDAGVPDVYTAIGKCKFTNPFMIAANWVDIVGFDIGNNPGASVGIDIITNGGTTGNNDRAIGNYLHDIGQTAVDSVGIVGCPEAGIVLAQTNAVGTQVLRNLVVHYGSTNNTACNHAKGNYLDNGIIEGNIVIDGGVASVQLSMGCGSIVSNNVFIGGGNGNKGGIILEDVTSCLGHNTFNNNYFSNSTNAIFTQNAARCTSAAPNYYGHNISDSATIGTDVKITASCDTIAPNPWTHQVGSSFFVNYQTIGSSGDYHLKSGSLGINAGTTACASGATIPCVPSTDIVGNGWNGTIDVGAYGF